jgi:hypothetical protein
MNKKDSLYMPKEQKEAQLTKQFLPSEMAHICLALKKGGWGEEERGYFVILCSKFLGLDKPLYLFPPSHDSQ